MVVFNEVVSFENVVVYLIHFVVGRWIGFFYKVNKIRSGINTYRCKLQYATMVDCNVFSDADLQLQLGTTPVTSLSVVSEMRANKKTLLEHV